MKRYFRIIKISVVVLSAWLVAVIANILIGNYLQSGLIDTVPTDTSSKNKILVESAHPNQLRDATIGQKNDTQQNGKGLRWNLPHTTDQYMRFVVPRRFDHRALFESARKMKMSPTFSPGVAFIEAQVYELESASLHTESHQWTGRGRLVATFKMTAYEDRDTVINVPHDFITLPQLTVTVSVGHLQANRLFGERIGAKVRLIQHVPRHTHQLRADDIKTEVFLERGQTFFLRLIIDNDRSWAVFMRAITHEEQQSIAIDNMIDVPQNLQHRCLLGTSHECPTICRILLFMPMILNPYRLKEVLVLASKADMVDHDQIFFTCQLGDGGSHTCRLIHRAGRTVDLSAELSHLIALRDIGMNWLEHCPGNIARVHCSIPGYRIEDAHCSIQRGCGGWDCERGDQAIPLCCCYEIRTYLSNWGSH